MRIDLVCSHYAADLSWLTPFRRPGLNIVVYEKGEGPCGWSVTRLPNVGKNDHVYAHHLAENYRDLADWTLFTPDHPFDHLAGMAIEDGLVPQESVVVPWLCTGKDWDEDGCIRWHEFGHRPDRNGTSWKSRFESGKIQRAELDFVTWAKRFVGFDPIAGDWPGYSPGGVLGVPKAAITYLPQAFYARLEEQLSGAVEPEEGHYLERLWLSIFSKRASYHERSESNGDVQVGRALLAGVANPVH